MEVRYHEDGSVFIPTYPHREKVSETALLSTLNGYLDDVIKFLEDIRKVCSKDFYNFEFRVIGDSFEILGYRRQGGCAILNDKKVLDVEFE